MLVNSIPSWDRELLPAAIRSAAPQINAEITARPTSTCWVAAERTGSATGGVCQFLGAVLWVSATWNIKAADPTSSAGMCVQLHVRTEVCVVAMLSYE